MQVMRGPKLLRSQFGPIRGARDFVSLGAVITVLANTATRMAPHVVHVHACNSAIGSSLATALFQWTATGTAIAGGTMTYADPRPGKSTTFYNGYVDQRGFNAAFICWSAGRITITLTITAENGDRFSTSTNVDVVADTRTTVYCDEGLLTGTQDGSSPANAFQTWEGGAGAQAYMQASGATATKLLLNRGKTYANTLSNLVTGSSATNVYIGAYGTGANPLIVDTQSGGSNTIWDVRRDSENVIIQNIDFQGHTARVANALRFRTDTILRSVAILGCNASSVAQMTNTTENPNYAQGFLQMNCYVTNHLEYGFYGEYDDFVSLGCTSTNTAVQNESATRTSGFRMSWDCLYSKYYPNAAVNKDAFRVMTRDPTHGGEYVWVTRCHFTGPVQIAWNSDVNNPGDGKFQVLEDSLLEPNDLFASNTWLNIGNNGSAYEDITLRNLVFYYIGNSGTVNPPIGTGPTRTSARLVIIDNTLVIRSGAGLADLMSIDADGDTTRFERNLLISSSDGKAYFLKAGAVITAGNNVWYTTGSVVNVNGEGNLNLTNWNLRDGTATDYAEATIAYTDITSPSFRPATTFTTVTGPYPAPKGARTTDYHGNYRSGGYAGAVDFYSLSRVYADGTGDYTTISAWKDAVKTLSGTYDAECRGAVGAVTFATWVPSSSTIYGATGSRHSLDITGASMSNVQINDGNITIEGMRISSGLTWNTGSSDPLVMRNCVVQSSTASFLLSVASATAAYLTLVNNVFIDTCNIEATSSGGLPTLNVSFYGNFVGVTLNLIEDGAGEIVNASIGNSVLGSGVGTTPLLGTLSINYSLSAGDLSSFGGSGNLSSKPLANQVVDVASNWKLKAGADAINTGAALIITSPDALGRTRPITGSYDIGPGEYSPLLDAGGKGMFKGIIGSGVF